MAARWRRLLRRLNRARRLSRRQAARPIAFYARLGSDDLVPDTRPDPKKPEKPGKFVADPPRKPEGPKVDKGKTDAPKLVCANGTVRGDACSCARTDKKVKIGKNAFRCVKSVVDPVRPKDGTKTSGGRIKGDTKPEAKSDAKPPKRKGGAARASKTSSRLLIAR